MASQHVASLLPGIRRQQTQVLHDGPGGEDPGRGLHREGETTTSVDAPQNFLSGVMLLMGQKKMRFFHSLATTLVPVGGARGRVDATFVHFSI